jgi:hypothetical protein
MGENTTELPGGSSLEEILQRQLHRFAAEGPALVDRDEFAAHIAVAFEGSVPAEAFVQRFFAGNPELAATVPDLAGAIVATADKRLEVYEFELATSEYLVLEDGDNVVVAGDGGQVEARYDEPARQAVRAAVISDGNLARAADGPAGEPRAYLVRESGSIEILDAGRLASALAPLAFRQVMAPVVERPARRLVRFSPRPRRLSAEGEERVLRENDPRMSLPIGPPRAGLLSSARPDSADPAVFVLLPDGTIARPAMGAASRWRQMVSGWTARAALLDVGSPSMRVSGDERFTFLGNKLTAFVSRGAGDGPGELGARTDLRAGALAQVRSDLAPVRILGDDDLAQIVARGGARLVPGWTAAGPVAQSRDSFWVQPEGWFAPTDEDRALVARLDPASGLDAPSTVRESPDGVFQSPRGDLRPTLAGGAPSTPESLPVAAPSPPAPGTPALDGAPAPTLVSAAPAAPPVPLSPATLPLPTGVGPTVVNVASPSTPSAAVTDFAGAGVARAAPSAPSTSATAPGPRLTPSLPPPPTAARPRLSPLWPSPATVAPFGLAPRTGALPVMAFGALQLGIERTAAAGAHRLPLFHHSVDAGRSAQLARVLASMPFPNAGEVHVGRDLSDSLGAYAAALVLPLPAFPAPAVPVPATAAGDLARRHSIALAAARRAASGVERAEVRELLGSQQAASLGVLPRLLRQALRAAGNWVPGPGTPMPPEIAAFAAHRPFQLPQIAPAPAHVVDVSIAPRPERPLGLGEDEIVVPAPLWAEIGRRDVPAVVALMSSPVSRSSYSPPLGSYRAMLPRHVFTALDVRVSDSPSGGIELAEPAEIRLEQVDRRVQVRPETGPFTFATFPEHDTLPRRRPRVRIGAPLDRAAITPRETPTERLSTMEPLSSVVPPDDALVTFAAPQALPSVAQSHWPVEGSVVAPAPGVRPMTTALQDAPRLSRAVARPAIAEPTLIAKKAAAQGRVEPIASPGRAAPILPPRQAALASSRSVASAPTALDPEGRGVRALGAWQPPAAEWMEDEWPPKGMDVAGSAPWEYVGTEPLRAARTTGGGSLARMSPEPRSVPMGLRFRYVSAPLWWSPSLRKATTQALGAGVRRSLGAALLASNSAATLWRSMLSGAEEPTIDLSGGMDRRRDLAAHGMSGVSRRLEVLVQLGLVGPETDRDVARPAAPGPETVYLAIDEQGRAGTVAARQVERARSLAAAVDMRMVAALPPSPPPLESMSAMRGIPDAQAVRARQPQAKVQEDKADEAVSQSKIEGSVEAVAQRIYHRVRRRLASDRERFGG